MQSLIHIKIMLSKLPCYHRMTFKVNLLNNYGEECDYTSLSTEIIMLVIRINYSSDAQYPQNISVTI